MAETAVSVLGLASCLELVRPFDWAIYALWLWGLAEMFCLRGTLGSNRFGPDPLTEVADEAQAARIPAWDQQSEVEIVPYRAPPPRAMS